MKVNRGALDGQRALKHLSGLPFAFVPILSALNHVMICLIACAVIDKTDLMTINGQLLSGLVKARLLDDLPQRLSHGADAFLAPQLELKKLLVAKIALVILTDKQHLGLTVFASRRFTIMLNTLGKSRDKIVHLRTTIGLLT